MASIWWLSSRFFLWHSNPIRTRIPSVLGRRRGNAMCVAVGRRRLMPPGSPGTLGQSSDRFLSARVVLSWDPDARL
uniref:Putative secreted protein n=1 Tax=Anopheles darlingi TaxID=43151 RepID=A0A2M4D3Z5_ANODA